MSTYIRKGIIEFLYTYLCKIGKELYSDCVGTQRRKIQNSRIRNVYGRELQSSRLRHYMLALLCLGSYPRGPTEGSFMDFPVEVEVVEDRDKKVSSNKESL